MDRPELETAALDAALTEAHEAGDSPRLVSLHTQAADDAEAKGDIGACCFHLTQAYVFALACDAPEASSLHARLLAHGREE